MVILSGSRVDVVRGDVYVEPRSATATPMVFEEPFVKLSLTGG